MKKRPHADRAIDIMTIDPSTVSSAVLRRLIREVQQEESKPSRIYDRVHNRHNRGPFIAEPRTRAEMFPKCPRCNQGLPCTSDHK